MSADTASAQTLTAVIYREGHLLDTQAFDAWLDLYCEDAQFWMPAWTDENRLTNSPDTELSLIYCAAKAGLQDRVWRVRSGLSVASTPLLRTTHLISNTILITQDSNTAEVHSSWTCHTWNIKRQTQHAFFGRYEHRLKLVANEWQIARKKIILMNDRIPTMLDFYCV
ncbi:MAG: aromatic-ring-hydroxylating dioxygenase subunit beta [Burkholderiaceae bacterium]